MVRFCKYLFFLSTEFNREVSSQDPPAVDADYINAFHHVILPIAYEVNEEFDF